jgi:hypothetical protein
MLRRDESSALEPYGKVKTMGPRKPEENHGKTLGKWWFNGI